MILTDSLLSTRTVLSDVEKVKYGRRPAQINTEVLIDLKLKKRVHRR